MSRPAAGAWEWDAHRAVQTIVPRTEDENWFGSGYLLTADLVLTAAHVLHGARRVKVRFVEKPAVVREMFAEVVFTSPDAEIDVAVLQFEGSGTAQMPPVTFGTVTGAATAGEAIKCAVVGFPRSKTKDHSERGLYRDTHHAIGSIPTGSDQIAGTLALTVNPPEADPEHTPWGGFSGSAVFADDKLIAIVIEHHPAQGLGALTAIGVDRWYELRHEHPVQFALLRDLIGLPADAGLLPVVRVKKTEAASSTVKLDLPKMREWLEALVVGHREAIESGRLPYSGREAQRQQRNLEALWHGLAQTGRRPPAPLRQLLAVGLIHYYQEIRQQVRISVDEVVTDPDFAAGLAFHVLKPVVQWPRLAKGWQDELAILAGPTIAVCVEQARTRSQDEVAFRERLGRAEIGPDLVHLLAYLADRRAGWPSLAAVATAASLPGLPGHGSATGVLTWVLVGAGGFAAGLETEKIAAVLRDLMTGSGSPQHGQSGQAGNDWNSWLGAELLSGSGHHHGGRRHHSQGDWLTKVIDFFR